MIVTDSFTPKSLRDYLLLYLEPHIGTITFEDGTTDYAITVGNAQYPSSRITGLEINMPLFPAAEEVSLVDRDTASYINLWELHLFLWTDSDEERLKMYEVLCVMVRMLSGVKIYPSSGGLANGFDYSEHYVVCFVQTCTGEKIRIG